jgi:hypothetical protein
LFGHTFYTFELYYGVEKSKGENAMKNKSSLITIQTNIVNQLIILALAVSLLFVLTGCSSTNETTSKPADESTDSTTVETAEEAIAQSLELQPIDHQVDKDPTPLTEADKTLSPEGYGAKGALADNELTIVDMLMYAVEDEYLARGEYLAIMDKFGVQKPYSNIINSEETHLSYLEEVYLAYGLEFPADTSEEHIIIPADLLEAAKTGVQAEIDNIEMYELFLTFDLPDNVYDVFSALKNGSDNHLRAFQRQVDRLQ